MKTYDHTWLIAEWERMGRPECQMGIDLPIDSGTYGEILTHMVWRDLDEIEPTFSAHYQYRIKCKPSINWEHVSDDVMAMATDDDGDSSLFRGEPVKSSGWWHRDGEGFIVNPNIFASFTQGTCDWRDSLVMRPVVVGEEK